MILFYSGSTFLSVSGSVLSLESMLIFMLNILNLFLLYKQLLDPVNLLVPPTVSLVLNCHDSVNLQRNCFNYPPFLSIFR